MRTSHDFKKGDLVWWTMELGKPLPFKKGELFVGIVVNVSKIYGGVEVFWFNNRIFKTLNHESLMHAEVPRPLAWEFPLTKR